MKKFYNFMVGLVGWIFILLYPVKIIGSKSNVPKTGKLVLISNHLSFRDIPVLVTRFPGYRHFIAKKEFSKNRLIKWFFTKMGAIFVDRQNLDLFTIKTALSCLKNDEGLALFPEGTRNRNDESIQQVKGGAALFAVKGQAPLVPVVFQRKIKPFRRTFVYVGEPIELSQFYGKKFDSEQLNVATKIISDRLEFDKAFIDDYVVNKRWKNKKAG